MSEELETPIGILPSNWDYKEIGPHVEMTTGPAFDSTRFGDDPIGIRLARGINITRGRFRWSPDITKYWPKVTPDIEKYLLRENDVIIGMDGSLVGRNYALVQSKDAPSLLVQRVARLRTDNHLDCRFLYYFIASDFWLSYVDIVKTNSGIPHISNGDIREFRIAFPPTAQQRKIARILTTVDNLIEKTEALIAKYQAIKQGMMHDLFTRGVDSRGHLRPPYEQAPELYKQSELGWIPKEWEVCLLDDVAIRGSGHTPNKLIGAYWNGGIKWVSLADSDKLDRLFITDTDKHISELGLANSSAVRHRPGTVILSRDAGIGKSAIISEVMAVSQHFMAWFCGPRLVNFFLYYWLQHEKPAFEAIAMGSTIKTIGLSFFKKLRVAVPSMKEQRNGSNALLAVERRLFGLAEELTKYKQQKTGLMQDLLTGKVRVKVDEAEEVSRV